MLTRTGVTFVWLEIGDKYYADKRVLHTARKVRHIGAYSHLIWLKLGNVLILPTLVLYVCKQPEDGLM